MAHGSAIKYWVYYCVHGSEPVSLISPFRTWLKAINCRSRAKALKIEPGPWKKVCLKVNLKKYRDKIKLESVVNPTQQVACQDWSVGWLVGLERDDDSDVIG